MTDEEPFSALDHHFAELIGRLSARRCIELDWPRSLSAGSVPAGIFACRFTK